MTADEPQKTPGEKEARPANDSVADAGRSELFAEAVRHHHAERLGEAVRCYRQVLVVAPHHADSLQLVGMIAYGEGPLDWVVELMAGLVDVGRISRRRAWDSATPAN